MEASTVVANLSAVRERIAAVGGDPGAIKVVAVTKGFGPDAVAAAAAAGLADVGENYAQELLAKRAAAPEGINWHFIGAIQRNKISSLAPHVSLWQSVDRLPAGESIARHRPGAAVLVQVNVSGEPGKHGCRAEDAPALVEALRRLDLEVRGLMAIGPAGEPQRSRPGFRRLARLASGLELPELSMGMTADLEVAVQEGSTMVRVGRALFGPRPKVNVRSR